MSKLSVTAGPASGQTIEVGAVRFVIGRDDACDLVLADTKVSRRHAYLVENPNGEIEAGDLGSSNGTFVDGERLSGPAVLKAGSELAMGRTRIRLAEQPQATPASAGAAAAQPPAEPAAPSPDERSMIRRLAARGGESSLVQRIRLERSVRRATMLAVGAVVVAVVVAVLAVSGVLSGSSTSSEPTTSEIINNVKPSVARVLTSSNGKVIGSGTGWVYDADQGLVVTNAHVVGEDITTPGPLTYQVAFDGKPRDATLYADSPCYDLALLKVDDTTGLKTLPIDPQSTIEQGDPVTVIGYPANDYTAFGKIPLQTTSGTVSVVSEPFQKESQQGGDPDLNLYPNLVQTDAAINHGNSGGPLVDQDSHLVGVNTLTATDTQQQGFAIGSDLVQDQISRMAGGNSIGYLGFDFQGNGKFLIVRNAIDGTPASDAGFGKAGVAIVAINGKSVTSRRDYCKVVKDAQTGDKATIDGFNASGSRFTVKLPFQ